MSDPTPSAENDAPVWHLDDRCTACGKTRFAHVPDPPDGYWPDCTTFVVPAVIDAAHLARQQAWSRKTFGPGTRLLGVLDHIRKELKEIEADPTDVEEWVDVIILALDGAWRAGWEPQQIIDAIKAKQAKNEARTWPDWRTLSEDQAIEHASVNPPGSGRAPVAAPDAETEYAIENGWLVEVVNEHTCGAGGSMGHEPGCGLVPVAEISDALAAHDAQVRAEALRDLSDAWQFKGWSDVLIPAAKANVLGQAQAVTDWLHARIARAEGGER